MYTHIHVHISQCCTELFHLTSSSHGDLACLLLLLADSFPKTLLSDKYNQVLGVPFLPVPWKQGFLERCWRQELGFLSHSTRGGWQDGLPFLSPAASPLKARRSSKKGQRGTKHVSGIATNPKISTPRDGKSFTSPQSTAHAPEELLETGFVQGRQRDGSTPFARE